MRAAPPVITVPAPIKLLEVELTSPIPDVSLLDSPTGLPYGRVRALVRLHSYPVGIVDLRTDTEGQKILPSAELASVIWEELSPAINRHLMLDGHAAVTELRPGGLPAGGRLRCEQERAQMLARAPFVSVVVPTHDRPDYVGEAIRSLLAQTYPRFEIIVVDNGPSTSATSDLIGVMGQSRVRYIREERPSASRARNRGLHEARGAMVAFSDDDVLHDPNWLAELIRGFDAAPNVGAVTGSILPRALETPAEIWLEEYGGFNKGFERLIFDMDVYRPASPLHPYAAGSYGSGASMAFRTDLLKSLGGFDEALGPATVARGGEDLAAFFNVVVSNHQLVYVPSAIIYHAHRSDYSDLRNQLYGYGLGLTAYLTKCIADDPRRLFDMMVRLPWGMAHALSPHSKKNRKKAAGYPRELSRIELQGMVNGPLAFLRSRVTEMSRSHA